MNPFKTKKGLGRGLSSLIGDADTKPIKNKISISSIIRNKLSGEVETEARNYFKDKVYSTAVPRNVRLSEAPSHGVPVLIYDKSCPGSRAYFSFTEEFLNQDKPVESAAWLIRLNQKKDLEEDYLP